MAATHVGHRRSDAGKVVPLLRVAVPSGAGRSSLGVNPTPEEGTMKYALLIYSSPESRDVPEDQVKSVIGEYEAIFNAPGVLDGMQLQAGSGSRAGRLSDF
jgi:hypothetical protein